MPKSGMFDKHRCLWYMGDMGDMGVWEKGGFTTPSTKGASSSTILHFPPLWEYHKNISKIYLWINLWITMSKTLISRIQIIVLRITLLYPNSYRCVKPHIQT